ncbi:unnamed protein product [Cochlearia groenlandica]
MKQCDRGLSPFPIGSSSSLSFAASESDPEDSYWRDFAFDFSFLTSDDDSLSNISRHANPTAIHKASVLGVASITPLAKSVSVVDSNKKCGDSKAEGRLRCSKDKAACSSEDILVSKDIDERNSSPLFSKTAGLRIKRSSSGSGIDKAYIPAEEDDTELDSPCWRGMQSHDNAASGTKSWNFRSSGDDLNSFHRLNPLAPHFIPSSAKKSLDDSGKQFEENGSSSLKRSLSSTFPPSSGDFNINNPYEARIEQESGQKDIIESLIHNADESLGLVSQDSLSKTMSILDITNQFQSPKKLDPLAPVFVPATAKPSAVVHGNHDGAKDHVIAIETNTPSTSGFGSSDNILLNSVLTERHSSEVDTSFRKGYSGSDHESGTKYSFKPRFGSQVRISEKSELDSSSNKFHGQKKLNPLAPQFSLADTKQNIYGSVIATKQMGRLSPSLKVQPTMDVPPFHISGTAGSSSLTDVKAFSDSGQRYGCSTSSPSPKMDVKKLLTTIHGLSELLIHSSESSDSPNEQDLDLINSTVQNLNSYMNNRVQGQTANFASTVHSSYDTKLVPNMRKAIGNHQTEDQINPQVYFYKSLWLKAKADRSLMEYERFLSETSN